jgi:hypothetical protein
LEEIGMKKDEASQSNATIRMNADFFAENDTAISMKFDDFPWPAMGERKLLPTWEDGRFIVDSEPFEILTYSQSESAWSPELTALHEKGSTSHPIDIASRTMAVASMKLLRTRRKPIILDVGCSSGFLVEFFLKRFRKLPLLEPITCRTWY